MSHCFQMNPSVTLLKSFFLTNELSFCLACMGGYVAQHKRFGSNAPQLISRSFKHFISLDEHFLQFDRSDVMVEPIYPSPTEAPHTLAKYLRIDKNFFSKMFVVQNGLIKYTILRPTKKYTDKSEA